MHMWTTVTWTSHEYIKVDVRVAYLHPVAGSISFNFHCRSCYYNSALG